jgi:hypothetical protein
MEQSICPLKKKHQQYLYPRVRARTCMRLSPVFSNGHSRRRPVLGCSWLRRSAPKGFQHETTWPDKHKLYCRSCKFCSDLSPVVTCARALFVRDGLRNFSTSCVVHVRPAGQDQHGPTSLHVPTSGCCMMLYEFSDQISNRIVFG